MPSAVSSSTLPPRERAFALYCQGQRSPAIALALGLPERTIRAWITSTLRKLAEENASQRREHQALAIARYEAISNAAWEGYARATALEHAILTATLASLTPPSPAESATLPHDPSAPSCPPSPSVPFVLKSPTSGARYLAVAMAADREISRLQGLYLPEATKPHQDVKIILERREPTAENYPPGEYPGAPTADAPDSTRVGGFRGGTPSGADLSAGSPAGAPTADATAPARADDPCGKTSLDADRSASAAPDALTPDSPAESATLPPFHPSLAREGGQGVRFPDAPPPGMPRLWKRRSSRYPYSRLPGFDVTYGDDVPYPYQR